MKNQTPKAMPNFLYGTAWKELQTEELVLLALKSGFRAIDTANQRKHYCEEAVGNALDLVFSERTSIDIKRTDVFLQTKFTFANGQDHRIPYDLSDGIDQQVFQSFQSSLLHLRTDYLDSYVLHGPSHNEGLHKEDWLAWKAMEQIHSEGKIHHLGISNVDLDQLSELCDGCQVKPSFVQNRCYANSRWDKDVRLFCQRHNIIYQGFSLLTANWKSLGGQVFNEPGRSTARVDFSSFLKSPEKSAAQLALANILKATNKKTEQVVFRFVQQLGMIPLIGTRTEEHMLSDLNINDFKLSQSQLEILENIAFI